MSSWSRLSTEPKASYELVQVPLHPRQVRGHGRGVELGRQLLGSLQQLPKVRARHLPEI